MWDAGGRPQAMVLDPGRTERTEAQSRAENHLGSCRLLLGATVSDTTNVALSQLRIIVFPDSPKAWTARSLEHDLSARGTTAEAAIDTLVRIAEAHIAFDKRHGRAPLSAFASAPRLYWNAFARAERTTPVEVRQPEYDCTLNCVIGMVDEHPIIARYHRPVRIA